MGAGQPRKDIGFRTCNWCWYWLVKVLTGKSDDDLDEAFIDALPGESDRPKTLYRIRGWGTSPKETRGFRKARTIFEVAHELPSLLDFQGIHALTSPPRYPEACYLLVSPLWEMLTTRNITLARLKSINDSLLRVNHLERFAAWQLGVLERPQAGDSGTLQDALAVSDKDLLCAFRAADDVDSLALLIALFKEAAAEYDLSLAVKIETVVLAVVTNFTRKWQFPDRMEDLLMQLVMDRGLGNIWLTEEDWAKETDTSLLKSTKHKKVSESERREELNRFINWYIQRPANSSLANERVGLPLKKSLYERIVRDHFDYDVPCKP